MPIRLPDIPQLGPAVIGAPLLNDSAAAAPGRALGALAGSIADASREFHETAVEVQKRENARALSEGRMDIAKRFSQFEQELERNPNPAARIDLTREFLDAEAVRIDGLSDDELPPAVRDQLRAHFSEAGGRFYIGQTEKAARLSNRRARQALENELSEAARTGDSESFETALGTAREGFDLTPEEEARMRLDFERGQSAAVIDAAVNEDPAGVLLDIERDDFLSRFPGLSLEDIPRIRSAARASSERHRSEELELMESALLQGKLDPADIEAAGYLRASDIASLRKALTKKEKAAPLSPEQHGTAWDALLSLRQSFADPSVSDSEYASRYNDTRAGILEVIATTPPGFREDITGELSRRSPANRSAEKLVGRPAGRDTAELKAIAFDRITRARAAGMLGNVADDAPAHEREKAYRTAEELRLRMSRWIAENPEADLDAIAEKTDAMLSGDRVKTTALDLSRFIPGQRLRPAPVMPALPPKTGGKDRAAQDPMQIPAGAAEASDALLPARQQLDSFLDQ